MSENLNWMEDPVSQTQFADTDKGRYTLSHEKVYYDILSLDGKEISRVVAPGEAYHKIIASSHYEKPFNTSSSFMWMHASRTEFEWRSRERELLHYNNEVLEKQRADTRTCKKAVSDFDKIYALLKRIRSAVHHAVDNAEDEGDRVYFGSTNDLDSLKEVSDELESFTFDMEVEKGSL